MKGFCLVTANVMGDGFLACSILVDGAVTGAAPAGCVHRGGEIRSVSPAVSFPHRLKASLGEELSGRRIMCTVSRAYLASRAASEAPGTGAGPQGRAEPEGTLGAALGLVIQVVRAPTPA
jgi:hypothetical protein